MFEIPPEFMGLTPGQLLRELRTRKGVTQDAFAARIGYTRRQIARWENDHFFPGPLALRDLCEFYDIRPEILNYARSAMMQRMGSSNPDNAFDSLRNRLALNHATNEVTTLTCHNVDWIFRVDNIQPDYETTIEVEKKSAGGSGANTIATLGRLGLTVASLGVVADDENGRFLIEELKAAGVDTDGIVVSGEATHQTGYTSIYADAGGRRTIYHFRSINYHFADFYQTYELRSRFAAEISNTKWFHLSSFPDVSALAVQSELVDLMNCQQILSFNPGAFQAKFGLRRLERILRRTNVLFMYDTQLKGMLADSGLSDSAMIAEDLIGQFFGWRAKSGHDEPFILVLKNSPELVHNTKTRKEYITAASSRNTAYELTRTGHLQLPPKYATCVDSTGAGDNCAAGIIYGLFRLASFEETVDLAFGLALRASSEMGARPELQCDDIMSLRYLR